MQPPHRILALLALAGLAWLPACGGTDSDAPLARGVVHLSLSLEDGRSSADVLLDQRQVLREWRLEGGGLRTFGEDWQTSPLEVSEAPDGDGARLQARAGAPGLMQFVLHEELRAEEVDVLEIRGRFALDGGAMLSWETVEPVPHARELVLRESVQPHHEPQTLRFLLSQHPGWSGTIRGLRLRPCAIGPQRIELDVVRLVQEGFEAGPEREDGDGGLVGFVGDARRAWPSSEAVPLLASASVPRGGRVEVETALVGRLHASERRARFAVDARAPEGEWDEIAARSFVPADEPGSAQWDPLVGDLSEYAGQAVELRFRAWFDEGEGTGGSLGRAAFLWGRPMIVGELGEDRRPNLLLITLDTLRADAVGYAGGPPETPTLDALAARSLWFSDAWSTCNSTLPSHASLLTGLDVPSHGALTNRAYLEESVRTLAQTLRDDGYHTAAAVSVGHLDAGYCGFGRGFDQYQDMQLGSSLNGARTSRRVLQWMEQWNEEGERPWFVWLHLFDVHTPYGPPDDFLEEYVARLEERGGSVPPRTAQPSNVGLHHYADPGKFLEGVTNLDYARFLYAAGVAYADQLVGEVVEQLEGQGAAAHTVLAITSDHGESLGENEIYFDHALLHQETVHVPLLLHVPGGPTGRVQARSSGTDVAPTLARLAGLELETSDGIDLLELASNPSDRTRRVHFVHASIQQLGCRDEAHHFVRSHKDIVEIYPGRGLVEGELNLHRYLDDPACQTDLAPSEPELAERYDESVREWFREASTGRYVRAATTAEQSQVLDDLGYGGQDD